MQAARQSLNTFQSLLATKIVMHGEKTCNTCGKEYAIYTQLIAGEKVLFDYCFPCRIAAEDKKLAVETKEAHERMEQGKAKKFFDKFSLINPDLQNASFKNYEITSQVEKDACETACKYVRSFNPNDSKNLILYGSYGVGKSHLAKSICDQVIKKGHSALFVNIPKLLKAIKTTFRSSEISEAEMFQYLETVDLLILDDLGTGKHSEWVVDEVLFPILEARQGMNTIATTNLNPDLREHEDHPERVRGLEMKIGGRNFSRMMKRCKVVEIIGQDKR